MRWLVALVPVAALGCGLSADPAPAVFDHEVPALVPAVDVDPDPRVVEVHLTLTWAEVEYVPGVVTRVLAYVDDEAPDAPPRVPGPMIETDVGDLLVVRLTNGLDPERTTLHFHGARLPVEMDGNPAVSGSIAPGESFEYRFVTRDEGLYWYHPHLNTPEHLELGAQGPLVVRDPSDPEVPERVLMLDDVGLTPEGEVDLEADHDAMMLGFGGDQLLVNGRAPGRLSVTAGATERLRIVSSSNGRPFRLFADSIPFTVVGVDGGPVESPYSTEVLDVAPGERFDVLFTYPDRPTGRVLFETLEVDRGYGYGAAPRAPLFEVALGPGEPAAPPAPVDFAEDLERLDADAPLRTFVLRAEHEGPNGHLMFINDQIWPFNEWVRVPFGETEVWEITNAEPGHHPFHVHGMFFQVVAKNGVAVDPVGWKDTVPVGPGETVRLAIRYDAEGHWLYHCQVPMHAHMGMMGDLMVEGPTEGVTPPEERF